ncbi:hypothetical protein Micbo1qcDRAFT_20510 [Microdochium bolleyi]|uniref:Uncharacterized protein n=1 Tax=Microdochium bolleyi TaxID=196109 RepID=A0A136ISW7_9PEZI|nr:hypothetical protein Micbo1qcDRAFT_20510 [Microdochium bolleyi]
MWSRCSRARPAFLNFPLSSSGNSSSTPSRPNRAVVRHVLMGISPSDIQSPSKTSNESGPLDCYRVIAMGLRSLSWVQLRFCINQDHGVTPHAADVGQDSWNILGIL